MLKEKLRSVESDLEGKITDGGRYRQQAESYESEVTSLKEQLLTGRFKVEELSGTRARLEKELTEVTIRNPHSGCGGRYWSVPEGTGQFATT